ncbi:unnamed protein product [Pylaiella littoralis]
MMDTLEQQQQQQQLPGAGTIPESEVAAERETRIMTWNINGLRKVAADHGGVKQLLDQFNADIVCFQEIKITRAGLVEHDLARAQGYHGFFNHCKLPRKVSYSGTATFVRSASESGLKTLASTTSLGDSAFFCSPPGGFAVDSGGGGLGPLGPDRIAALDSEGRVLVTDHGHFVLFNVYAPCIRCVSAGGNDKMEERREFKRDFLGVLEARILEIRDRGRRVVLVGDLNACASQLDHGFTMTDTQFYASNWSKWIRGMLGMDSSDPPRLVDCFRLRHPGRKNAFTCWNTQTGARENNYGTRIDYIIADASFADRSLRACDILQDFLGSDHCPVRASFVMPLLLRRGLQTAGMLHDRGQEGGRTSNDDEKASTIEGEGGWPEHPPECSCFYRELRAKQEKLAKYFTAGGQQQQALGVGTQQQRRGGRGSGAEEEAGAGSGRRSSGVAATWLKPGGKVEHGYRALGTTSNINSSSSSSSSSKRALTRKLTPGGSRQSTLTFGAASPVAVDGGGPDRGRGHAGVGAVRAAAGATTSAATSAGRAGAGARTKVTPEEDGDATQISSSTDDERGKGSSSSTATATSGRTSYTVAAAAVQSRPKAPKLDNDGGGGGGGGGGDEKALSAGGEIDNVNRINSSSSSSSSGDARGVVAGSDVSSKTVGSAEAWKALFGQKKSAPPCEHGEPSIQRTVLKPGPNFNRRFYSCARFAGNWPTDRNARCNFFQWRRDGVRGYKERPPRDESSTNKKRRV